MARVGYEVIIPQCSICLRAPFLYVGFIPSFRCLYLGETRSYLGALGRISQHLSETSANTFKQRICQLYKYDSVQVENVRFLVIPFSNEKRYWTDAAEYRIAVEYLVQLNILNILGENDTGLTLISRVVANGYTRQASVVKEAAAITKVIKKWILSLK